MLQAFDTIMQCAVSAQEISKSNIAEPFRYECLCCGEEVHIAAAESKKKAPHFRHLRGNSDKDCELYLGSMGIEGAITAARRRSHNHAEIFFDIAQKAFFISISFSEEKLSEYESKSCILEFHASYGELAYESVKINQSNFAPDNPVLFPLQLTSNDCIISIIGAGIRAHYEILKQIDFPTFFKIQTSGEHSNRAKRHTDGIIYTNTPYFVLAQQKSYVEKLHHYTPEVFLGDIEEINAFGETIFGAEVVISSISIDLWDTLQYFGYSLVKSEQVNVLWPPVFSVDNALCCNARQLFLSSSFELCAKSNISCEPDALKKNGDVFVLDISNPVRLYQGNIDMQLSFDDDNPALEEPEQTTIRAALVDVTEAKNYYLIDSNGYRELPSGRYHLTKASQIVCFSGNYPSVTYLPPEELQTNRVGRLRDILKYYKVSVPFKDQLVANCQLSNVAETYIEDCRISGVINNKALAYIRAGMI